MPHKISSNIFKVLFDSVTEGLFIASQQGEIIEANPQAEQMFGYESGELIGEKVEILIPKNLHKEHVQHRTKYAANPTKRSMGKGLSLKGKKKDNSVFPIEISLNYFESEGTKYVVALITDISERVKIEEEVKQLNRKLKGEVLDKTEELKESQMLYLMVAKNFPSGTIIVIDENFNYLFAEGKEKAQHDRIRNTINYTYLNRFNGLDIEKGIKSTIEKVFSNNGDTIEFELNNQYYILNAVPLQSADGSVSKVLLVENNVTAQKEASDKIIKALNKEKELGELKSRFVSMASHEFKTPLTTILSSTTLISKYADQIAELSTIDKHVNRIKNSVRNLNGILNDFLSIESLESGRVDRHDEKFELLPLIEDIADEMRALAKTDQNIVLDYQFKSNSVLGDPHVLRNILINLLSNAIKYSKEGKNIILSIEEEDGKAVFKVIDQGIGIPEAEQERLFQRFFRAKNAFNIQGTGLGLNIVQKYVELLNGTIEIKSIEGAGTTVIVKTPIVKQ